ncbi:DUF1990 domain-containing protein [Paeniglutamicibacter antarcticus]|uniref:DUF1990 domain-containing protein n=1 Tax=Arthrobacter terrae TaxID=2935737 RepID=A0A931CJL7_9MICC|nr:DUF1990 domain-containing protein [Arthrobacter terrae]MBG0738212.1 DUF1990 domain-containing protein [Arthrobacter terrae]
MKRPGQGELTYPERGVTQIFARGLSGQEHRRGTEPAARDSVPPAGYRWVHKSIIVGRGRPAYERLAEGILSWEIQRGAGLAVRGPGRAVPGVRVVSGFGIGDLRLAVPCQVVWAQETDADAGTQEQRGPDHGDMAGFGYGTLPGHPASGEEAFTARLGGDGTVWFDVLAFSKPAGLIFRLAAPVTTLSQRLITRRYLHAARRIAAGGPLSSTGE